MITVQLRYDGWVTEMKDPARAKDLSKARGIDNLLYRRGYRGRFWVFRAQGLGLRVQGSGYPKASTLVRARGLTRLCRRGYRGARTHTHPHQIGFWGFG